MAVALTINGVDRSKTVNWESLQVENVLTNQLDTASFQIFYDSAGATFQPTIGHIVRISDGSTVIFEGPIVSIEVEPTNYQSAVYKIECTDYTRFLDRKLVIETYENMTVAEIIASIVANFTVGGFTTNNVVCDTEIAFIAFNYEPVSDCIKQLAELVSFDWYVDNDKDIHFFDQETNLAPFDLTDTSANWDHKSLVLRNDNSQVRNQVYVRGGEYLGSRFTAVLEATGNDFIYPIGYRYSEIGVTLTGNVLDVGVDYLDLPEDHHVLYNFQEKILRWQDTKKPSAGALIRVHGLPYLPVIVKVADQASQQAFSAVEGGGGIYESVIIDKSITSKQAARDRADAEIERYKETIVEGQFITKTAGLRAGQTIHLDIDSRGIDETYIISRVTYSMWTPNVMVYNVQLITTKTYGIMEWMQRQLRDEKKKITINPDEIQDVVETADSTLSVTESFTSVAEVALMEDMSFDDTFTAYQNSAPTWVAGQYSPASLEDRKRPAFADRDCNLRT